MARFRTDLRITGTVPNATATELQADLEAFQRHCEGLGLEFRTTGCDVQLDPEPVPLQELAPEPATEPDA